MDRRWWSLALSLCPVLAYAQPAPPPTATPAYESVVTGSRTETALADAPIATEVITRAEIESVGAHDLGDVLATRPGIQLTRTFAGTNLQLQGLDPQYVLILVDGQRTIGRVDGAIDLTRFPIDEIERIEIVRGPASALYGADAIAGVVNLITRRARRRYEADALAQYGSLNTADVRGGAGLRRTAFSARVSGGYHHRDAYQLGTSTPATSGSRYDELELGLRGEAHTPHRFKLQLAIDYLQRRSGGVDASATGAIFDRTNLTETFSVSLAPEITFAIPAKLHVTASYSLYRDQYLHDQRGSNELDQYQLTKEQLAVLGVQYDHVLPRAHFLSLGLEGQYESLDTDRLNGGHGDRFRGAFFAQDQWTALDAPRLVFVPAIRVDLDSQFGQAYSPKLAVRFDPHPNVTLRGSYGLGYRAPTFKELFIHFENPGVGYVVDGNPALRPETSGGFDLGAEVRVARWLWLSVNLYRNDLQNLITASLVDNGGAGGPQRYSYVNIDAAYTQGVESAVRIGPWNDFSVEGGYTLTDSQDETRRRRLPGRSLHAGNFVAAFRRVRWGLEVTLRGAAFGPRRYYVDNADGSYSTQRAPAYVLLDARVAETIKKHVTLFVGVQNLANAGEPQFTPLPPRTFYGGVSGRY